MAIDPTASTAYAANRFAPRGGTVAQCASVKQLSWIEAMARETQENDNIVSRDGVARLVASNPKITEKDAAAFLATLTTPEDAVAHTMQATWVRSSDPARDTITRMIAARDASRKALAAFRRTHAATAPQTEQTAAPAAPAAPAVPEGCYALDYLGVLRFYRVKAGKGRWEGRTFVNRFMSDDETRVSRKESDAALAFLSVPENLQTARETFSRETVRCYACGHRLTDALSRSLFIGPDCRSK